MTIYFEIGFNDDLLRIFVDAKEIINKRISTQKSSLLADRIVIYFNPKQIIKYKINNKRKRKIKTKKIFLSIQNYYLFTVHIYRDEPVLHF